MSYREFVPAASFGALVDRVWTGAITSAAPETHDVLPDGAVDLIATIHPDRSLESVFVVGAMTRPARVESADVAFLGLRFRPGAAHTMLGVPQGDLTDRNVALRDLQSTRIADAASAEVQRLVESLHASHAIDSAALDRLLRTLGAVRRSVPGRIQAATHDITVSHGQRRIAQVAAASGVTRQHLGRLFADHVGLTPKAFAAICRVRALLSLGLTSRCSWPELAARFGYSDQSHLIAEVRRLTGRTPSEWRADPRSISPIPSGADR